MIKACYPPAPISAKQWPDHSAQNSVPLNFTETHTVGAPSWEPAGTKGTWNCNIWTTSLLDMPLITQVWWDSEQAQDISEPIWVSATNTAFSPSFDQQPAAIDSTNRPSGMTQQQFACYFAAPYLAKEPGYIKVTGAWSTFKNVERQRYPTQDFNSCRLTARSTTVYHTGSALTDQGSGHHCQFTPDLSDLTAGQTDTDFIRRVTEIVKAMQFSFDTSDVNHNHSVLSRDVVALNDGSGGTLTKSTARKRDVQVTPTEKVTINEELDVATPPLPTYGLVSGALRVGAGADVDPPFEWQDDLPAAAYGAWDKDKVKVTPDTTDSLWYGLGRLTTNQVHETLNGTPDRLVLTDIPQTPDDAMRLDPKAAQLRAADGCFTPLRHSASTLEWIPTQRQFTLQTRKANVDNTKNSFAANALNSKGWQWGFSHFSGLSSDAKLSIKTISCWEATADHVSIMSRVQQETPKLDQKAIDTCKEVMRNLAHSYPASYNSLGTILQEIASAVAGMNVPLVSDIARFAGQIFGQI